MAKPASRTAPAREVTYEMRINSCRQRVAEVEDTIRDAGTALTGLLVAAKSEDNITTSYIETYRVLRDMEDAVKEQLKTISAMVQEMAKVKLPEAFDNAKTKTLTLESGDRVTISEKIYASIKAGMKEEAFAWLRKNKLKDLITLTVNASTLSAWAKTRVEENKDIPDDLFNVTPAFEASLTRGKKK